MVSHKTMSEESQIFRGIPASPGIAVGKVWILDRRKIQIPRYHIDTNQIDAEIARLQAAVDKSVKQLEDVRGKFADQGLDHQTILEAHEMMLSDPVLMEESSRLIRNSRYNAQWSITAVIGELRSQFEQLTDPYFRERKSDIDFVGDRIIQNLEEGRPTSEQHPELDENTIVVAHNLYPVDTVNLSKRKVAGFITELGSKTSHASIVARSMGVPGVVGVAGFFSAAGRGDTVLLDGDRGIVCLQPTPADLAKGRKLAEEKRKRAHKLLSARHLPAQTLDNHQIDLKGNIELPAEAPAVIAAGGNGIGLYRTEFMLAEDDEPPSAQGHHEYYKAILEDVGSTPVTIRTFDVGGDKIFSAKTHGAEPNPALGLRAIRYCLQNPTILEDQIRGVFRAAVHGDLRLMFPMISCRDEISQIKTLLAKTKRHLENESTEFATVPIGIMVEVPSAVLMLDELISEVEFFSVGTNDLMQYLFAIDRSNEKVAYLYNPLHLAMLRCLKMCVQASQRCGVPMNVCGEMAGDIECIPVLIGLGVTSLSMNANSIPLVKRVIRELRRDECEALVEKLWTCASHREVTSMVRGFLKAKAPLTTDAIAMDVENDVLSLPMREPL
jgi:phosphoenolpyruvate-protein phosphotransferase (PTS system enzyme I)